ncbi:MULTISPECIES: aldehyde dehydrogenase family protein [Mesorhizobium]|uniref:aldehyde dehydrogenase family protein n=1 Tax=Mesorhizobium TaxID=68287 RepID=UPI0003CF96B0|nr:MULTISPECIES: aldehyde dehydrogenase family protein [Mesorhizobium]ESY62218.1 aldehyde dehydrogenase [Mesorhizobium sp. LNHC232B00]WJI38855.1 aldehyde dehydrogenase family protein [Mesorhizobium opportunistum]
MKHATNFYIDGKWVAPVRPRPFDVINPATEEKVAVIALGSEADVDVAVAAARRAFATFSRTSIEERVRLLERFTEIYRRRMEDLAEAISLEMGAPITWARMAQAPSGLDHLVEALEILRGFRFDEQLAAARVAREPIGVCGLITPWNWPANQVMAKLAPALAVGCTVVLKPSEISPLSALLIAEMIDEAGYPAGVFNLANGDGPGVGEPIARHPGIDMVSFTGSTQAGILVAQNAAPTVKRISQELGGKSPNIILDDADFEDAVANGARRCFNNSGQTCTAPTRLLVPAERMQEAMRIASKVAEALVVGDPTSAETQIGPVANATQFQKVQTLIASGIEEGAELAAGGMGRPIGIARGYFVRPTVFGRVKPDMKISREEIFGPVLSIIGFRDDEEAIEMANDTPYGLSAAVSSADLSRAEKVARRIRAGMVHINGAPLTASAPFGGYKQSGNGREQGKFGFEDYLEIKSIFGLPERVAS